MMRSAISPRFATRTDLSVAVLARFGLSPGGRSRVRAVPRLEGPVDPFGLAVHARRHLPVELVLLGRVRVLHVRLFRREVDDHARPTGFLVLPEDLGVDVAGGADPPMLVPLLAERHEVAQALLLQLEASDRPVHRCSSQSGMLPCLRRGLVSRLPARERSAAISFRRVSRGSMTSSTYPRAAATYGFAKRSTYSPTSWLLRLSGSSALAISSRWMTFTAPSGPITAISADGQATL